MKKYFSIVTNTGVNLMAQAIETGEKVNLKYIAVGDADGAYYEPDSKMETIKHEVWRGEVNSYNLKSGSKSVLEVNAVIPASAGDFEIREIGLYDEKNRLIAIGNAPETHKNSVENDNGIIHEIDIYMEIVIENKDAINITVDTNAILATKKELEDYTKNITESLKTKADKSIIYDYTIMSSMWTNAETPFFYRIEKEGITENNIIEIIPRPPLRKEQMAAMAEAEILTGTQETGAVTLEAYGAKPEQDIPITMIIRGDV